MLQKGGLVGFDEHPSPTVWKSPVRKSSENTLSAVISRKVMRERHVAWWPRESPLFLHPCWRILSRLAFFANRKGELAILHAPSRKGFRFLTCS